MMQVEWERLLACQGSALACKSMLFAISINLPLYPARASRSELSLVLAVTARREEVKAVLEQVLANPA